MARLSTAARLWDRAPDFLLSSTSDVQLAERLLAEGGDYIDALVRMPGAPAAPLFTLVDESTVVSARTFEIRDAARSFRIPPYVGTITAATISGGRTMPTYRIEPGTYGNVIAAVTTEGEPSPLCYFPRDSIVTLTAKWGFSAIPEPRLSAELDYAIDKLRRSSASREAETFPKGPPDSTIGFIRHCQALQAFGAWQ